MAKTDLTLKDLKAASYNPRSITNIQLEQMRKSYEKYGDLSGIIYNKTTGTIVGGHQRTSMFKKGGSKIVREPHKDATGTVATGYVVVQRAEGGTTRIPYREVEWDGDTEMAANIAANASGGDFDPVKLGKVLKRLEQRKFDIEEIPLDGTELKHAIRLFESMERNSSGDFEGGGGFAVLDPEAMEQSLEHECPKCGYSWSGQSKPSKPNTFKSNKYHDEKRAEKAKAEAKGGAKKPKPTAEKPVARRASTVDAKPVRKAAR